jgi:hypothetical protein
MRLRRCRIGTEEATHRHHIEPLGRFLHSSHGPVTRPAILFGPLAHLRADRVADDVRKTSAKYDSSSIRKALKRPWKRWPQRPCLRLNQLAYVLFSQCIPFERLGSSLRKGRNRSRPRGEPHTNFRKNRCAMIRRFSQRSTFKRISSDLGGPACVLSAESGYWFRQRCWR